MEFVKKWRFSIMLVLMVMTFAYVINNQANQNQTTAQLVEDFLHDDVDDQYDACLSRVDLRSTMYSILDAVVEGDVSITTAVSLVNVAGYEGLDPATQLYLANLDAAFASQSEEPGVMVTVRDDYKENFPIPDCEEERAAATEQLEEELNGE